MDQSARRLYHLKNVEAIIFDFNGTLINDERENRDAWLETARHFRGVPFTEEEFRFINGKPDKDGAMAISPNASTEELEEISLWKETLYKKLCIERNISLLNGAERFLSSITCPIAIASSAPMMNMEWYYPYFHLNRWFSWDNIICGRDDLKGKPEPDYFLEAARILNVDIRKTIIFEDSEAGLEAARRAGAMQVIAVNSPYNGDINIKDFSVITFDSITE